jgi:hypothetical protein
MRRSAVAIGDEPVRSRPDPRDDSTHLLPVWGAALW